MTLVDESNQLSAIKAAACVFFSLCQEERLAANMGVGVMIRSRVLAARWWGESLTTSLYVHCNYGLMTFQMRFLKRQHKKHSTLRNSEFFS